MAVATESIVMTAIVRPIAILALPPDRKRGSMAMGWFIATEAMLFVSLFFAYFYLGRKAQYWPPDEPPKLPLALTMLTVLLASSAVLEWAKHALRRGNALRCRLGVAGTIALGLAFIGLQAAEYGDHLKTLTPSTDAYGSIFYTITSIHGLHVILGMLMLAFALAMPRFEPRTKLPYHPFHNASMYWHFVDAVWVIIVAILYVLPRLYRG